MSEVVLVYTPFPADSQQGNSVSARRIAGLLNKAGLPAQVIDAIPDASTPTPRALIALHACKAATALAEFGQMFPGVPRHLLLPGSDLYRCLPDDDPRPLPTMELADTLIVAQEASLADIPASVRAKARFVPKSLDVDTPDWNPSPDPGLRVLINAHLRAQKDPFLALRALEQIPDTELQITHIGGSAEDGYDQQAADFARTEPRFRTLGQVPRTEAIQLAADSHILLNTSLMEGGANSISEALHIGLPVLATAIPGNIGMLGQNHPGLFSVGDADSLAELLERAATDKAFLEQLSRHSTERSRIFTPEAETAGWLEVLGD